MSDDRSRDGLDDSLAALVTDHAPCSIDEITPDVVCDKQTEDILDANEPNVIINGCAQLFNHATVKGGEPVTSGNRLPEDVSQETHSSAPKPQESRQDLPLLPVKREMNGSVSSTSSDSSDCSCSACESTPPSNNDPKQTSTPMPRIQTAAPIPVNGMIPLLQLHRLQMSEQAVVELSELHLHLTPHELALAKRKRKRKRLTLKERAQTSIAVKSEPAAKKPAKPRKKPVAVNASKKAKISVPSLPASISDSSDDELYKPIPVVRQTTQLIDLVTPKNGSGSQKRPQVATEVGNAKDNAVSSPADSKRKKSKGKAKTVESDDKIDNNAVAATKETELVSKDASSTITAGVGDNEKVKGKKGKSKKKDKAKKKDKVKKKDKEKKRNKKREGKSERRKGLMSAASVDTPANQSVSRNDAATMLPGIPHTKADGASVFSEDQAPVTKPAAFTFNDTEPVHSLSEQSELKSVINKIVADLDSSTTEPLPDPAIPPEQPSGVPTIPIVSSGTAASDQSSEVPINAPVNESEQLPTQKPTMARNPISGEFMAIPSDSEEQEAPISDPRPATSEASPVDPPDTISVTPTPKTQSLTVSQYRTMRLTQLAASPTGDATMATTPEQTLSKPDKVIQATEVVAEPVVDNSTLVNESPAPVSGSPVPVSGSPAPVNESPAPLSGSPAPVSESPAPVSGSPVPMSGSPAPVNESPAPLSESPVPMSESPVPMEICTPEPSSIDLASDTSAQEGQSPMCPNLPVATLIKLGCYVRLIDIMKHPRHILTDTRRSRFNTDDTDTPESTSYVKVTAKSIMKEHTSGKASPSGSSEKESQSRTHKPVVRKSATLIEEKGLDPWSNAIATFGLAKIPKKKKSLAPSAPAPPRRTDQEELDRVQRALKSTLMTVPKIDTNSNVSNSSHNQGYTRPGIISPSNQPPNSSQGYTDAIWLQNSSHHSSSPSNQQTYLKPYDFNRHQFVPLKQKRTPPPPPPPGRPSNPYDDPTRIRRRDQRNRSEQDQPTQREAKRHRPSGEEKHFSPPDTFNGGDDSPGSHRKPSVAEPSHTEDRFQSSRTEDRFRTKPVSDVHRPLSKDSMFAEKQQYVPVSSETMITLQQKAAIETLTIQLEAERWARQREGEERQRKEDQAKKDEIEAERKKLEEQRAKLEMEQAELEKERLKLANLQKQKDRERQRASQQRPTKSERKPMELSGFDPDVLGELAKVSLEISKRIAVATGVPEMKLIQASKSTKKDPSKGKRSNPQPVPPPVQPRPPSAPLPPPPDADEDTMLALAPLPPPLPAEPHPETRAPTPPPTHLVYEELEDDFEEQTMDYNITPSASQISLPPPRPSTLRPPPQMPAFKALAPPPIPPLLGVNRPSPSIAYPPRYEDTEAHHELTEEQQMMTMMGLPVGFQGGVRTEREAAQQSRDSASLPPPHVRQPRPIVTDYAHQSGQGSYRKPVVEGYGAPMHHATLRPPIPQPPRHQQQYQQEYQAEYQPEVQPEYHMDYAKQYTDYQGYSAEEGPSEVYSPEKVSYQQPEILETIEMASDQFKQAFNRQLQGSGAPSRNVARRGRPAAAPTPPRPARLPPHQQVAASHDELYTDFDESPWVEQPAEPAPLTAEIVENHWVRVQEDCLQDMNTQSIVLKMGDLDGFVEVYKGLIDKVTGEKNGGRVFEAMFKLAYLHDARPVSLKRLALTHPEIPDINRIYNRALMNIMILDDNKNLLTASKLGDNSAILVTHPSLVESILEISRKEGIVRTS